MRYEARNVAAHRLDDLLGAGVIVRSQIAQVPTTSLVDGGVMQVPGASHTPGQQAEAVSNQGLLMAIAPGMEAKKLVESGAVVPLLNNGAFMRDLNSLALVDCLLCSMDRHFGNFHVDVADDGTYRGLKGIDNDFSLQGAAFDLHSFHSLSERDKNLLDHLIQRDVINVYKDVGLASAYSSPTQRDRKAFADLAATLAPAINAELMKQVDAYMGKVLELGYRHWKGSPEMLGLMQTLQMQARELGVPDDHAVGRYLSRACEAAAKLADITLEIDAIVERQKAKGVMGVDPLHNIGLPGAVDRQLAMKVLSPDFEAQMVGAFTGLLTPQEIDHAVDRLHVVQDHLRGLEASGRLLDDHEWKADRVDRNGVRLDDIQRDPRHNHIARMQDRYESHLAEEAEKQAKAAARAAAVAAAAAAAAAAAGGAAVSP
jgi:hypothetical protein